MDFHHALSSNPLDLALFPVLTISELPWPNPIFSKTSNGFIFMNPKKIVTITIARRIL